MKNNRRDFIKSASLGSLGLVLGFNSAQGKTIISKPTSGILSFEINPFIIVDTSGKITLVNSRPDMGQGSSQAVPSLLAEELEVSLDKVTIIPSDGRAMYGSQQSGGSSTVRGLWNDLRKTGAAAKEMLLETAAEKWGCKASDCYAKEGAIFRKGSDQKLSYGELATEASQKEIPANPKLKDPKDFKLIGKFHPRLDVPLKVTGKAVFGIDVVVPGMLYATVVHAPSVHGKLVSVDDAAALKVSGVKKVLKTTHFYPGGSTEAVAVVASNYWSALKASRLLNIQWDHSAVKGTLNSDKYFNDMKTAATKPGIRAEESGDFDAVYAAADKKLEALYETPFLAHAAIEPVNATAHVKPDGTVEVWAPIQGPDGALAETAQLLGINQDKIKINPTLLGGSFGRKAFMDFMKEAIDVSKQMQAPVKLIWSREEDMSQGPFRPAMMSKMRGTVSRGNIAALSHQAIGESIQGQHWNGLEAFKADDWLAGELSKENHKYNIPVHHVSYSRVKTPIPILWWRSVYASNFAWSQECFIDELAAEAGKDPIAVRKELLKNEARDRKVIEKLEEIIASYPALPANHARGVAMFRSFSTMSAAAVEVSKNADGSVKIEKVTSVIDCGQFVNPDMVKAQTEGNIVMGITAAVKGGITFSNEKCDQSNYHEYQVMRMSESPKMDIHIIENLEKPGGVGEPGLPPIAPALGNAIFNLTGKRIRRLPIDLNNIA